MNWILLEEIIYIGIWVVFTVGLTIGLIVSAVVFCSCIVTKSWTADIKFPRSWRKRDKEMAEKWGEEWDKLERIKARRK